MKKLLLFSALVLICSTLFAQTPSNWLTFDTKQQPTTAGRLVVAQKSSFGLSFNDDLTQLNISDDDLGHKHYRYQQIYQNYPVEGAQLLVHENQYGLVYAANGGLVRGINQNADVVLSEQAALDKALAYSKGKTFAWQDANYQKALQHATENDKATFYPKGELVWASNSPKQEPQSYKLSYKFDVFSTQPLSRKFIFVDAQTGELVTEQNQLHDADAPCTGTARYSCSNPVSITADNQGSFYRLRESSTRKVETYTANNGTSYAFFDITSTDNNFNEDQTATAVHWSTEKTYDYYKNTHNRNSFDGTNGKLMSWAHFDTGYDNAFWNGSWMTYGDGSMFSPLVSTDVVGHEITHGVTQYTANLTYSYEPGALNESFSDIFGTVVEFYADPTCADWKIGEDITAGGQGIRNMQNPNLRGQPDTYLGTYWYAGNGDNGGVHYNSGVQNYWFYLLCQGGSGTNDHGTAYNVTAIGMTKAARIAYRMLTVYLTATSQYSDTRAAAIQAATDLYGASSPELTQVVNAWCAVGVGSCALNTGTIAVTSPNGGEVWQAGSTRNITWTSTGTVTNVDIYYSIDGGTTWNFIANQANTGSRIWTVANTPTTLAQVRVTNSGNASITDDSNANFTIQGCNVLAGFSTTSNTVCIPTTLSFTNTSTGATTYEWKVNNLTQGTSTNLSYNFTTQGSYTVQLTAVNGACSDTYTQTITVQPTPNATFTHTENDLNFSGFATQLSANSYTWNFGDGSTSTAQSPTHTYAAAGTYNVCLTVVNGCGSVSGCQSVTLNDNSNTTCWQTISAGSDHTIAIKTDGTLWAWGRNWTGELGDGTNIDKNIPTQIGTTNNWQSISAGSSHTIAIKTDGTLWAWGYNALGGLGDGTNIKKNTPTQIGTANNWQSVSAGGFYTTAIKTDGTLWAWGYNNYGQLGDGTNTNKNTPTQIGAANNWQSISAGSYHTIAIKTDGTLWAWGYNAYGQLGDGTTIDKNTPTQIGTTNNWQSVRTYFSHTVAIKTDGTLWAWGNNYYGELGDGTNAHKYTPTQIGTTNNWQSIRAGEGCTIALKTDGTLWAWGENTYGQLGDGTTTNKNTPTQIGTTNNWQSISTSRHTIALKTDGTLWAWGYNAYGELGDGTTTNKNTPTFINGCTTTTCSITPQFTTPTTTCSNTPYTFTNTSTGATAYQWKANGTPISTATNLTYTFPTQGTYTITLEASNGTCTDTYSQTITVSGSATQLNLGSDVMQCGSSPVTLNCGISGALWYNWDLNGNLVGTTQTITATQSGTYYLSVMDACNQVGVDSISVLLDDDCVWPGDVNYDNIVNYLDLLPIGLNYGASGSTRPNANFAFNAQPCQDWNGTQANGQNLKHADCNGNGIIDNNDPAAIQLNYSQTHGIAPANPVNSTSPIALSAALGTAPASFSPNTIVRIDLYANNTQNLNVTAYGFGFDVNYQFPNCVKVNSAYIDFTGSWLGTNGVNMATVQKNFLNSNLKSGHLEVAMTRLNHQNQNGYGKVGTLVADVDIYATTGSLQAAASMSGQQMTVANGSLVPIGGISGSFNLANPAAPTVTMAANPTTALIGGSCNSTLTATVGNCSGCTYQWKRNSTVISGAASTTYTPTQTGTYYVIVTASGGLSASASVSVAYNNAIVNNSGVALPFCTPTGINSSAEYIKSVQFGTDAANITVSDNGYGNFTCSKVFNVPVSCSATLTLQPKFVGATQTEYWTVWVDKNMDGDFVDAGEQIWQKTTTNGNAFSKTFLAANIPSTLLGKNFRMRVAMKRGSYATSPCENFAYGEVEDYTLRFVASSCKTDETAGVEDETTEAFADMPLHLFPNPVSDQLTVNFIAQTEEQITIRVYDIIGRLVFEEPIWSVMGENTTQISTQQLPQGIYLLQISGNDTQNVQRFVKR